MTWRFVTRPALPAGVPVPPADVPVTPRRPLLGAHQDGAVRAAGQPAGGAARSGATLQQTQHHQGNTWLLGGEQHKT